MTVATENGTGKYTVNDVKSAVLKVTGNNLDEAKQNVQTKNNNVVDLSEIIVNATNSYGKVVTNYDTDGSTGVNWKTFHSDGTNIYLIADDYIEYDKIPDSTKNGESTEHKPNRGDETYARTAYFTDITIDYDGSSNITSSNPAYKWLSKYYATGYTSTNDNMKAVAYMMDTQAWSSFKKSTAKYAIGGPTMMPV